MIALLLSRGLGALGFQILTVWMSFQVYRTTGSYLAMGSLGLGFFIANLISLLFGGFIVDRFFRRSGFALFLLQSSLALLATLMFFGFSDSPRALLAFAMATSFLRQIRSILYVKTLSGVVSRGGSSASLAKWNVFSWQSALFLGPLLFSRTELAPAIAVACLALSAIVLLMKSEVIKESGEVIVPEIPKAVWLEALRTGWLSFRNSPVAFKAWVADSLVMLFVGSSALLPFLLARHGINPHEMGTVRGMIAFGAMFASFGLPVRWISQHTRRLFSVSLLGIGILTMGLIAAPGLTAILAIALLIGFFDGISVVVRDEWLLRSIPRESMGSVAAVTLLMISVSDDLGDFRAGVFAGWIGLNATLLLGSALAVAAGLAYRTPAREAVRLEQAHS
ncbi:MAG: MFS transporter [Methylotenera sp.]|nr:MFS transporter [Oligoflexia bacterium]